MAPFMILDAPELKRALFDGKTPKVVRESKTVFFAVSVFDRIEAITTKSPEFERNLKKLDNWLLDKQTLGLFLDDLLQKEGLEFYPEKIYDKYENIKKE